MKYKFPENRIHFVLLQLVSSYNSSYMFFSDERKYKKHIFGKKAFLRYNLSIQGVIDFNGFKIITKPAF